jgi:hypothetical protein
LKGIPKNREKIERNEKRMGESGKKEKRRARRKNAWEG